VRPAAMSKSRTLSMMAHAEEVGSRTTWLAVNVAGSKNVFTEGEGSRPARASLTRRTACSRRLPLRMGSWLAPGGFVA
jgi:hypothetical protein